MAAERHGLKVDSTGPYKQMTLGLKLLGDRIHERLIAPSEHDTPLGKTCLCFACGKQNLPCVETDANVVGQMRPADGSNLLIEDLAERYETHYFKCRRL